MLAAAPNRDSALGLLQVVLRSVETHPAVQISNALKDHVVLVLQSASQITSNPANIRPETPAEAIELALHIRGHQSLTDEIAHIQAFENIRSDFAKELLKSLQSIAA